MGIFDLFKRLFKEEKVEEIVVEKITFSDIRDWIEKKKKENELKEGEILAIIKEKIEKHFHELKEKIIILKGVDVESRKEREDLKGIVNKSRKEYIQSLESFLENLVNLRTNRSEEYIKKINKYFLDFNKSSYKNYERTTILIGKEMGAIKEVLKSFSKELIETFDEIKGVLDYFEKISSIKSKLEMILSIDETLEEIGRDTTSINEKIKDKEEENRKFLGEIEKIKGSSDYLERLKIQKKIGFLKEELKNEISKLKQLLDFKALTNFFHINEGQMKMLKNHREDFQKYFLKDGGETIINLLDESKLNKEVILEKVDLIRKKIEEISNYEKDIPEDNTKELYPKIKEVIMEIGNLKIEKSKEEKRSEKLVINKEEFGDSLKQELGKMNVKIEG